jgi:polyphosphate glucokinase
VKVLATGQTEPRKSPSGKRFTPTQMVETVRALTEDWQYDAVSIGYPGLVGDSGPRSEPLNLAPGWVGFDFTAAFDRPVRIINDAAMQALGSFDGGRMLFLGLGTGLGSALIDQNVLLTLELGQIPYPSGHTLGDALGRDGLRRLGKKAWRKIIAEIVPILRNAFVADYIVLGGGNAGEIKELPHGARLGHNLTAFRGGFRLWHLDMPTLDGEQKLPAQRLPQEWRVL